MGFKGPSPAVAQRPEEDPLFYPYRDAVPGSYVVTLAKGSFAPPPAKDESPIPGKDVATVARQITEAYGAEFVEAYGHVGAFLCLGNESTARTLSHDNRIACVEANARTYACGFQSNPGWGLDRIDQQASLVPGGPVPDGRFTYVNTGDGVDAWVIDSGIYKNAGEFNNVSGRVVAEFPNNSDFTTEIRPVDPPQPPPPAPPVYSPPYKSSDDDSKNGHGTAVSVILGGKTWGVARKDRFHAIKVLNQEDKGTMAGLLAGLDYITNYVIDHPTSRRSVINMSLAFNTSGYTTSQNSALFNALGYLLFKGVAIVSASADFQEDAASYRPAGLSLNQTSLVTVGTSQINYAGNPPTSSTDSIGVSYPTGVPGSNFGPAVDLFAPGKEVTSVKYLKVNGSYTVTVGPYWGSSFAAPLWLERSRSTSKLTRPIACPRPKRPC